MRIMTYASQKAVLTAGKGGYCFYTYIPSKHVCFVAEEGGRSLRIESHIIDGERQGEESAFISLAKATEEYLALYPTYRPTSGDMVIAAEKHGYKVGDITTLRVTPGPIGNIIDKS